MPPARPAPRKYVATVRQSLEDLDTIAEKAKTIRLYLANQSPKRPDIQFTAQDIEAMAYRTALELTKMKMADSCDNCPSAPATTQLHAYLYALAKKLRECSDDTFDALEAPIIAEISEEDKQP